MNLQIFLLEWYYLNIKLFQLIKDKDITPSNNKTPINNINKLINDITPGKSRSRRFHFHTAKLGKPSQSFAVLKSVALEYMAEPHLVFCKS